jgi:exopolysaccharide biosynthesis operon protein EpsL
MAIMKNPARTRASRPGLPRPAAPQSGSGGAKRASLAIAISGVAAALGHSTAAQAAADAADPFDFYVADRYWYDDNLFRLSDLAEPSSDLSAPRRSRDDYVNRVSAGIEARVDASRQVFGLDLRIDDVRYQNNDDLDYTGGEGKLNWKWQLGSHLSGDINGSYERALASFNNYELFVRDIVDVASYGGRVRYGIGSRWGVFAGGSVATAEHSAEIRKLNEFHSETGRAGIEYQTPSGNLFTLGYDFVDARFPVAERTPGVIAANYEDTIPAASLAYAFTVKTSLYVRAGYLSRDYEDPTLEDYSGDIWNVTLHWEPRAKIDFDIKAWRDLRAYSDAESDYFVSTGGSIEPHWDITSAVRLLGEYSMESQKYVGTRALIDPEAGRRDDDVQSARVALEYSPRDLISIALGYNWMNRDSNRVLRTYDDNIASVQVKLTF